MNFPDDQNEVDRGVADDAALWRRFRGTLGDDLKATPVYRLKLSGPTPDGISLHLKSPLPADELRGEALMRDVWRIGQARRVFDDGAAPWGEAAPSRHFADRVHRFDWLPDLFTQGEAGADRARYLVDDWIDVYGKFNGFTWRIGPTADRVWNWLRCGAALFEKGEDDARKARLESLMRQIRHLEESINGCGDTAARWRGACVACATCLTLRSGKGLDAAEQQLDAECTAQILPDGGHVSRSPQRLLYALADLLALKDLYARADRPLPDYYDKWLPRMGAMLGFFRSGDGGLDPFNDGGEVHSGAVDAVMEAYGGATRQFSFAMKSGYQKLEKNGMRLVLDCGAAPEPPFADMAHAGALSFELSDGETRIISSCGYSPDVNLDWQAAVRRSGAHSALILGGRDTAAFITNEATRLLAPHGPEGISAKRLEEGDEIWLDSQHAGYKTSTGLLHRRRLFMAGDGSRLAGEDSLVRPISQGNSESRKFVNFEIRFHLHPGITAMTAGDSIRLISEEGHAWRFKTSHPGTRLEPSIYLGRGRVEKTEQIVMIGKADPNGDGAEPPNCVRWAFLRDKAA